jgi:hypothetical protein
MTQQRKGLTMTEKYRTEKLDEARRELAAAQDRLAACKVWGERKRDAAEQVEFWGNKVAFLNAVRADA